MAKRHKDLKIPKGVSPDQDFVQILDPATGTGTFLVEVIDLIHKTLVAKWKAQGHGEKKIDALWNEYVPKHLLTRLHGYELLMAPYAIAHLKIGLKLYETGYRFGSDERARVYLTNALEPTQDFSGRFEFAIPALAHEAQAVNTIKSTRRFTVVIGNPPYAGRSWNLTTELRRIVDAYRTIRGERIKEKGALQLEKSIQDDYIKFFRLGQSHIDHSSTGILGFVTSHGFLDNPSLRGMRFSILSSFNRLFVLDMHGNVLRHEQSPDGTEDKNVFDIKDTGVAVSLLRKLQNLGAAPVEHAHLWGSRELLKYPWLSRNTLFSTTRQEVRVRDPLFLLIPQDVESLDEFEQWFSIGEVMPVHSKGVVTGRDHFVIDFDEQRLLERMREFAESKKSDDALVEAFDLNPTDWWRVDEARRQMPRPKDFRKYVRPLLYRPFDTRVCFYHPAVLMSPRRPVMQHMDPGLDNFLLITSRMTKGESFQHVLVAKGLAEAILLSSKTSNNAIVFPLYLYADAEEHQQVAFDSARRPNFTEGFLRAVQQRMGLQIVDGRGDIRSTVGIDDLLKFIVATLNSPKYRSRYADPLSRDFPRVPFTGNLELFRQLARLGDELIALYLLESLKLAGPVTEFVGGRNREVEKASWSKNTVWIDKAQTTGFKGVREDVWNFHIGGYQVCEKWLKDRKGRTLSKDDIAHYQKIVVALSETIRLMKEIDQVIERHGGWPGAFKTGGG